MEQRLEMIPVKIILDYLQYLNEYEAKDEEEIKTLQDLIFITEMIIQSIELTMEG